MSLNLRTRIKPNLIHPLLLHIAILDEVTTQNRVDPDFGSPLPGREVAYEPNLMVIEGQKQPRPPGVFDYINKTKGGWTQQQRVNFLVYTKDVIVSGKIRFNIGDKIVKVTDKSGLLTLDTELLIRSILPRGEYGAMFFTQLECEKVVVALQ